MRGLKIFKAPYLMVPIIGIMSFSFLMTGCSDDPIVKGPEITSITPTEGSVGSTVVITGKNFSAVESENIVTFNEVEASVIVASSTEIAVTVPEGASTGKISITTHDQTIVSSNEFTVNPLMPVITAMSPERGDIGTLVEITGNNFAPNSKVFFGNVEATEITVVSETKITVRVPSNAVTARIKVASGALLAISPREFALRPTISAISESRLWSGAVVTITGSNFSSEPTDNIIHIGDGVVSEILQASMTQLQVRIPSDASSGRVYVIVNNMEAVSPFNIVVSPIRWQKTFGGSTLDEMMSVAPSPDGGLVMVGLTLSSDFDVMGNHGGYDMWVTKLDAEHNFVWRNVLGGPGKDEGISIASLPEGGYIIAGTTDAAGGMVDNIHGMQDIWMVKLSEERSIVWKKSFGGSDMEYVSSVVVTPDNHYLVTGRTLSLDGDVTTDPSGGYCDRRGDGDAWILKVSPTGDVVWDIALGGCEMDLAKSATFSTDGDYIVGGIAGSVDGDFDGNVNGYFNFIAKVTPAGVLVSKNYFGDNETMSDVVRTSDGGYQVVGSVVNSGGLSMIKLNGDGSVAWEKSYSDKSAPGAYSGSSIVPTDNGEFLVTGELINRQIGDFPVTNGGTDVWVLRLNSVGDILSQYAFGGSGGDVGNKIIRMPDGDFVVAASTYSINGDVTANHGLCDFWIMKLWKNL